MGFSCVKCGKDKGDIIYNLALDDGSHGAGFYCPRCLEKEKKKLDVFREVKK